ncbi:MAG: hypothetical protein AVDCRST_MAG87-2064, partial [uncultured Thermomicrobiales bacterium]
DRPSDNHETAHRRHLPTEGRAGRRNRPAVHRAAVALCPVWCASEPRRASGRDGNRRQDHRLRGALSYRYCGLPDRRHAGCRGRLGGICPAETGQPNPRRIGGMVAVGICRGVCDGVGQSARRRTAFGRRRSRDASARTAQHAGHGIHRLVRQRLGRDCPGDLRPPSPGPRILAVQVSPLPQVPRCAGGRCRWRIPGRFV